MQACCEAAAIVQVRDDENKSKEGGEKKVGSRRE